MLKWSRLALALAILAAILLLVAGPGTWLDLWSFGFGFQLLRWSAYLAVAAALIALAGMFVKRVRTTQASGLVKAFLLGLGVVSVPVYWLQMARSVPPIHDISTDLEDPPAFVDVVPLRANAPNPVEHAGAEVAEAQRQAYPHIRPMIAEAALGEVFDWALEAARAMGWNIVAEDSDTGRIEATDTTFWFRFKDDVVIRVAADATGSRVDVRSKSRVGRSDVGTNARRIARYLERVQEIAREAGANVEMERAAFSVGRPDDKA